MNGTGTRVYIALLRRPSEKDGWLVVHAHAQFTDLMGMLPGRKGLSTLAECPAVRSTELGTQAAAALHAQHKLSWVPSWDTRRLLTLEPAGTEHVLVLADPAAAAPLTEDQVLLDQLLDTAPDAMVIVNREGIIERVNVQAEQVFGHHRSELVGQRIELLIPARYRHAHKGHRGGFFANPHTRMMGAKLDLFGLHKDGHEFPVEISLGPLETPKGMLVSAAIRDITDRKAVENEIRDLNRNLEERVEKRTAELLRSEERFHEAMDSMMEGVQLIDHQWRYTYMNDAAVAQSTLAREELMGRTMMDCYPGIEETDLFGTLRQCVADGQQRVFENVFRFPNGSQGVFELHVRPTQDQIFILSTDITARKQAEKILEQQGELLKKQNEELEQFAYIASHDLQEPLRMVTSYVELLERRYADKLDGNAREFIAFAVDGTQRMKRLIEDLLMYSRLGRDVHKEQVDLHNVFQEVRRDQHSAIEQHGVTLTAEGLPVLTAVRTAMVQLFQNIISNAIKFRRPGIAPVIHLAASEKEEMWEITFTDNGIGMDMRYAEQAFAPFKRLHSSGPATGSGIGLAVARKVVNAHGGNIKVHSVPNSGSTFTVTLPKTHPS